MANTGAKLSSFPEVNDIQTGDMFPLLSGGNTNAKIDYATLANAIIAKLKSEDVVQTQTNNANKLISAALAYSMNQDILQLEEDTSTEQEEKSVTAEIVNVNDADGGEAGLTLNLEPVQAGSGDPSSDNVRPISGWTGAKVTRTGKNLLDTSDTTHNAYNIGSIPNILKPNTTYTFSVNGSTTNKFKLYTAKSTAPLSALTPLNSGYLSKSDGAQMFTTPSTMDDLLCLVGNSNGVGNESLANILPQVELGPTATDYEPYQGDTYDITFPSEAGTVYGGTLDVVNGVLTVDRVSIQLENAVGESWQYYSVSQGNLFRLTNNVSKKISPSTIDLFKCSEYVPTISRTNNTLSSSTDSYLDFIDNRFTTLDAWKTHIASNPIQVVFALATPVTYQLTPIEVTTLLGDNTIWMDAEGTIKLDYKTNAVATKGDVNDALARIKALAKITEAIAPVESSYKATQNYSVGDYLIVDYKLYKTTAAIANGGTITVGTNVTATTIMAEIQALA